MKQQFFFFNPKSFLPLLVGGLLVILLAANCVQISGLASQSDGPPASISQPAAGKTITPSVTTTGTTRSSGQEASSRIKLTDGTEITLPFAAGSLLKSPDDPGVFWLSPDGTRQHIYDWPTFLAWGFQPEAIIIVQADLLDSIPMTGELTRLVYDGQGRYYWAADGSLWRIPAWEAVVTGQAYQGVPATPADDLLLNDLPLRETMPDYALLRDGDILYLNLPSYLYRLASPALHVDYGYAEDQIIDLPEGVLAADAPTLTAFVRAEVAPGQAADLYQMIQGQRQAISENQLTQLGYDQQAVSTVALSDLQAFPLATSLSIVDTGANLRQGPGLDYQIAGYAPGGSILAPIARNQAGTWFEILNDQQPVWISGSVATFSGSLERLPITTAEAPKVAAAEPTPVPIPASATQTVKCDEVPIRGFGKVWADHPEIQPVLGCPTTYRPGEHSTKAASQQFENGLMVWLEQDRSYGSDPIYVFFNDDHTYQRFRDLGSADPAKVGQTAAGFYPIGDKFSKIYWEGTGAQVKERLGWATSAAADTSGAFQTFNRGRMFWLDSIDTIFVIYDYYHYDKPSNISTRIQLWAGYEDTF